MFQPDARTPLFSFRYDDRDFSDWLSSGEVSREHSCTPGDPADEHVIRCRFPDGFVVTQTARVFRQSGAVHWVLGFENTGGRDSRTLSSVYDCDVLFPFAPNPPMRSGFDPKPGTTRLTWPTGCNSAPNGWTTKGDFHPKSVDLTDSQTQKLSCAGGRSSCVVTPFFDINQGGAGFITAVGWTGQWAASFVREADGVHMRSGIEQVSLYLRPGESIRTSSTLVLPYGDGQAAGHNAFRRLIRDQFSPLGKDERPAAGPLCMMAWGGLPTAELMERLRLQSSHQLGFETLWMDAGWYGHSTQPCPDEHCGDWAMHTGDWVVNPTYHPGGLLDVSEQLKRDGMGFMLWLEPERVIAGTPQPAAHPDWFLQYPRDDNGGWKQNLLLNLGNPEALQAVIDLLCDKIDTLGLSIYRQDFNIEPLNYWRDNDEPGRTGMTEIRYIMGLYAFWDALLERYPRLLIDNCASGGNRIDLEMISRSIPMWRSDYQCCFDREPEGAQNHNMGLSWWLSYSGTGMGRVPGDLYRARSCYASSLTASFLGYGDLDVTDEDTYTRIREQNAEYKLVRPYFSGDYYPVFDFPLEPTAWGGWQFDRPEQGDGILMAFRRPKSPADHVVVRLGGLRTERTYVFRDADSGREWEVSGRELSENGFPIRMDNPRESRLYFYHVKS